ncbi:MAG: hypothetical protein HY681_13915 [Chloroflexi bacterium]|nr:hypothetical protein [Chloroflexota bacterium]
MAYGFLSGLVAIGCCVSPVVMVLAGVATAAEAVTLGDTLYYSYGWFFRGVGLMLGILAIVLYLRRRNSCNAGGLKRYRVMPLLLGGTSVATYAGLFWFTKYLANMYG